MQTLAPHPNRRRTAGHAQVLQRCGETLLAHVEIVDRWVHLTQVRCRCQRRNDRVIPQTQIREIRWLDEEAWT